MPLPTALSVLNSFDTKLPRDPEIQFGFRETYRKFESSVSSTRDTGAIPAFLKEDLSIYQRIFDDYFKGIKDRDELSVPMPVLEKSHLLNTESDVMRLAMLQLIHPVNIALQELCPEGTRLVCGNETSRGSNSRFDLQWSLYSNDGRLLKLLAILEVKNTHVIHWDDFKPAEATEQTLYNKTAQAMAKSIHRTLLKSNAVWLSKQAAKYAAYCSYVAVFDWNAIFIFNFTYFKDQTRDQGVRGIHFNESGQTRGMTFRRLLFAFVARPLQNHLKR
ncbi:hypothetical protein ASPWEDRAFT_39767 [Aspergillus wentii DTO 134E9]|uniref:Fungal-type protein kinase domain-containing protein n=1 Tax=Aspergillus wentii DTO 134E9 TaxID=1073089 RepID=A0A1L9RIF7_ASPWE|nr:uncharacterized protein ASPWEDRAFT_39767 [Aspergillus wentii DTO 134E9]KAI9932343.1 hypothetical protein MW887_009856 [Aspergillus wentii]OJJ34691.1 hypothetical protein ASPWEDRAFT_39767 [Aspergillus wentii DTO 134E9]